MQGFKRACNKNNQLYKKKKLILLTDEENKSYKKQEVCYICKEGFSTDDDNKKYHKARDHCHYTGKYSGAAHSICNMRYKFLLYFIMVLHMIIIL